MKDNLRKMISYYRPYMRTFVIDMIFAFLSAAITLVLPLIIRYVTSEVIYMEDCKTGKKWSLGLNPMPDDKNYNVIYGFGYAKYIHKSDGIEQELEIFVPKEDSIKVGILTLKNMNLNRKRLLKFN